VKFYKLILPSLLALSVNGFSQTTTKEKHSFPGINNWEQVIAKATSENKFIMVDLSTEWCSWCKVMDKQHFTDPEVLSLMQPKLNSYMLDAEKDSIGQLLKLKFGVAAYPAFLFFTPQGHYLETWCGAMPKKYWMQYIKDSIDQSPISRPGIPSGLNFEWPKFVQKELKANFKKSTPSKDELNNFFASCDYKKFTDFNVCRFYPRDVPDTLLNTLLQSKQWLGDQYGSDIATDLLQTSINWKAYGQIQEKNWSKAWGYMNQYNKYFPQNEWELFNVKLYYYKSKMDIDSIVQLGLQNPTFIYDHTATEIVEFICENGKTDAQFKQAELWNKAELDKQTTFQLAKYHAQIKFKQSDILEAQKWAKIAIESASKEGLKLNEEEKVLNQIIEFKSINLKG